MKRFNVNKRRSSGKFRSHVGHTKVVNIQPPPMRGGWRL